MGSARIGRQADQIALTEEIVVYFVEKTRGLA